MSLNRLDLSGSDGGKKQMQAISSMISMASGLTGADKTKTTSTGLEGATVSGGDTAINNIATSNQYRVTPGENKLTTTNIQKGMASGADRTGYVVPPKNNTTKKPTHTGLTDNNMFSAITTSSEKDSSLKYKSSPNKNLQKGYNKAAPTKKHSPYKMGGMSWRDGQTPMTTINGVDANGNKKASPAKEPVTAILAGIAIIGAITGSVSSARNRKAQIEANNIAIRNEAKTENRRKVTMARDKVLAMGSKMGDKANQKSMQAKAKASPAWG